MSSQQSAWHNRVVLRVNTAPSGGGPTMHSSFATALPQAEEERKRREAEEAERKRKEEEARKKVGGVAGFYGLAKGVREKSRGTCQQPCIGRACQFCHMPPVCSLRAWESLRAWDLQPVQVRTVTCT